MDDLTRLTLYINDVANGKGHNIDELIVGGLKIIHYEKGNIRCKLLITDRVTGEDGVWTAGAMAGLIDTISAYTVNSLGDGFHATVSLTSSFYSTAKIQEEVEIEGRVTGTKGKLKAMLIEIIRERNREVIARGNLWMSPIGGPLPRVASTSAQLMETSLQEIFSMVQIEPFGVDGGRIQHGADRTVWRGWR